QLVGLLQRHRCLLVLDNLERVLESGAPAARYRREHQAYGDVLRLVAEVSHPSLLIVTSREKPPDLGRAEGVRSPARSLRVGARGLAAGRGLLRDRDLRAEPAVWQQLVERYGGNALALKVVAETIELIFGGDVEAFLSETEPVFGDIRSLLE